MSDDKIEIVRELFSREVPAIASGDVEIKAIARRVGVRLKVAVQSRGADDPIAACVGVRGHRLKKVADALQGERIDLIRWHDDVKKRIANSLIPAEIRTVVVDVPQRRATVFVATDQRSLVEGSHGINLSLAAELVGYEIVVETT